MATSHSSTGEVVYGALEREILTSSAIVLARKISEGVHSSERVVRTFIKRIEAVNPTINALVTNRFEVRTYVDVHSRLMYNMSRVGHFVCLS